MSAFEAERFADEAESDSVVCIVCRYPTAWDDGEPTDAGTVCSDCMTQRVQCPACLQSFRRAEFVSPQGIDNVCGSCAYARDMMEAQ